ncbi:MAG: HDIG domain-containing protein [Tannerellaceae bacterium]|jgi:putative nucleotidyltransferase with HDIG domain|nr:HDIG domain-containing protein [Tannerellaceae bacterium]
MKLKYYTIPTAVFFVVAAALIAYFFPREGKFRYQFYEGKPWRYELLTAPGDFPIYKTDEQVKAERDSVLGNFEPYFRLDKEVEPSVVAQLRQAYAAEPNHQRITPPYMQYIERTLVQLYKSGIVSYQELEELKKDNRSRINLLAGNVAQARYVSDLFTVRTAYEFILNNAPPALDRDLLRACNVNNYLTENVSYDKDMSARVKEDLLNSVPIANGMVQAGERIVDRGEIVDNRTYNILRSLKMVHESKTGGNQRQGLMIGGQFVLVFGLVFCFWLYLWSFRPRILYSRKNTLFMLLCISAACLLTELCVRYHLFNVYILPYAIVPIVVRTFFDSRTALFAHLVIVLICSLMVTYPHEFLILQVIAGMVVTFSLKDLSERSQLIRCAFILYLSYTLSYTGMAIYMEADVSKINWLMLLYFGINFILLMFTYILVYMLEKAFGYVSSITLVELSNINNPLLKNLSEVAPGTFQHSLQVSTLASDAAVKIGADAQLVRTGAMYHDIGKMANPAFFTENQGSVNPHDQLSYEESARIIIGHVAEGVKMAAKASLPQAIVDFIRTHHGRGKAKYFYTMYKNRYPDREPDEALFTYPGPNPFSKETGVLMMADSVEAASRSLTEHTEEKITGLVNRIIDGQQADGLLKNTPLTFRDVELVKSTFIEKLKIMYHTRISYPEMKK